MLIRPTYAVLAAVLAIGVMPLAACAPEPDSDTRLAIADVERKLGITDQVLKHHTYELREVDEPQTPSDASRSLYRMTGQKGERFYFEGPADPSGVDINQIAVELFLKKNKRFVSYDSAWIEIEANWSELAPSNQRIARAKALRHFDSRPSSVSPDEWEDRVRWSDTPWRIR